MLLPPDQRRALGAFIRSRREALSPASAGEAAFGGRRRTPGLRREEVAQLCGLSTTWYTWIEQGRDISLSSTSLARMAEALRLTPAERAYLFDLTRRRDPAPTGSGAAEQDVPAELAAALHVMTAPAYLLDRLWTARAWNPAAAHLFSGWLKGHEPCLLGYIFRDPSARRFISDWEDRARRVVAEFRADTAQHPGDAGMASLVDDLSRDSPDFVRLWTGHDVLLRDGGLRRFAHPQDGAMCYEQVTLIPAAHPDHKLVLLLPPHASVDAGAPP